MVDPRTRAVLYSWLFDMGWLPQWTSSAWRVVAKDSGVREDVRIRSSELLTLNSG
jgi:hypothetical protein